MSFSLFTNSNYDSDLVYSINGRYYSAINLSSYVLPEDSTLIKLLDLNDDIISSIPSRPLFVTLEGDKWIIYAANNDNSLMTLANSGRITNNEGVVNATIFKLPLIEPNEVNEVRELQKTDFPTEIYERFVYLITNGMSLSELQNAIPQVGIPESDIARPEMGLPGGSIGLSSVTSDGGRNAPVSIRRSALSEPGSPTYYDEGIDSPNSHQMIGDTTPLSTVSYQRMNNTPSSRIVLATATPMLNDPNQLQDMLNLIRPNQNVDTSVTNSATLLTGRLEGSGMRLGQMERDAIFTYGMNPFRQMIRPTIMPGVQRPPMYPNNQTQEDVDRIINEQFISAGIERDAIASQSIRSLSPIRNEYQEDSLLAQSYTQLMRQFYGISAELPASLVINGKTTQFIDFQTAANLLTSNQINRYILDPILQPWAGLPIGLNINRIITLFHTNGLNYLVKAAYNAQNGQIYPPI